MHAIHGINMHAIHGTAKGSTIHAVQEKNNKRLEKTKMNRYNMFTNGSFGD